MLKGIMRDQKFTSSDETEGAIAKLPNHFAFDDLQDVFQNGIRRLACVTENGGEYFHE
jgi:hypothetical protein